MVDFSTSIESFKINEFNNKLNKNTMDKNKKIRELIHYYCGGTYENRKLVADKICKIYDDEAINFTDSSLQLENLKVNRFEVIDKIGRAYVNYCDSRPLNIETSLQDNERTLKIFLDD